ncbi:scabin-related ADP-ribosyltransferase [Kitasatospora sp. Ki12]
MLPPGLAKFFGIVTGMKWPEADEDKLRTAGDDYLVIAGKVPELRAYLVELVAVCKDSFEGEAADAFVAQMNQLIGGTGGSDYVTSAGQVAKQLGDFAHKVANQVEYAKWMIIAQLIQLVAQIAWAIAMLPITFGGSIAEVFAAYKITGELIKQIFIWLFKQLLLHEFLSITTGMVMDGIIQGIQIGKGHKDHWEKESFIQAIEMGAINGLLTGPLELLTFGLGKAFGRIFGRGLSKDLQADLKALAGADLKNLAENELKSLGTAELRQVVTLLRNDATLTLKQAIAQVEKNAVKDLGKNVTKNVAKDLEKNVTKDVAKDLEKNVTKDVGKDVTENVGKDVGKEVEEKLTKVETLTKQMGETFEQELVKLGIDPQLSNAAGRLLASRLASEGARYAIDLGTFNKLVRTLAEASGKVEFGAIKADLNAVVKNISQVQNELKHLSGSSLDSGLKDLGFLRAEEQHLKETVKATQDLAQRAVGLMDGLHPQTAGQFLFRLGEGVGGYLKGGVQNILTEGSYNLTFGEDHKFTVSAESFYGGVAMGALGHLGHMAGGPLRLKLQDLHLPNYARFPLAVVSNLMGHPTSLWVSRPEGGGGVGGPPKGIFVGDNEHGTGPLDGARPQNLKTDSDGSSKSSGNSGNSGNNGSSGSSGDKTAAEPPAGNRTKMTGGDDGAKNPSGGPRSSDTSTPEPPKRSSTVGGEETGPKRTPEESAEPVTPPAHATSSATETPGRVPTTGEHEGQDQQRPVVHEEPDTPRQQTTQIDHTTQGDKSGDDAPATHPAPEGSTTQHMQHPSAPGYGAASTHGRPLSREDRNAWVVGDPPSEAALRALRQRPDDAARYALVMHTNADGLPTRDGAELSPKDVADVIVALDEHGQLKGRKVLDFVACGLNGAEHVEFVAEVMEHVWQVKGLTGLGARAADGPVWVVPGFSGAKTMTAPGVGSGHLVVARKVGFNAQGRPVVEGGGNWHEYTNGNAEQKPPVEGTTPTEEPTEGPVNEPLLHVTTKPSKLPDNYLRGAVDKPMPDTGRFGDEPRSEQAPPRGSTPGHEYHYTEAPEHVRAEADGEREARWRRTQEDLQDTYERKLSDAAEQHLRDPDDSGHAYDERAEARLAEQFAEGSVRFPEHAPADLPAAVRRRARDLMYRELAERPQERERILADLDGLVRVAAVREAFVRMARERFDHALDSLGSQRLIGDGTRPTHEPSRIPEAGLGTIRTDSEGGFLQRAEDEAARLYARPEDVPDPTAAPAEDAGPVRQAEDAVEEARARAGEALDRLTERLREELAVRADRERALAEADRLADLAARDSGWHDRLSAADRELLAAAGVTGPVKLSDAAVKAVKEQLRERVTQDFAEIAGPFDPSAGPRRGRAEAVERFTLALGGHISGLPHEFAVHAAREAAIRRAFAEAEQAAGSWHLQPEDSALAEQFGVTAGDVHRAKEDAARDLAEALDREVTEYADRPDVLRRAIDGLTDTGNVRDLLMYRAVREASHRVARTTADVAARTHDGLSEHAAERLTEGHADRTGRAFDEVFRTREDLTARRDEWRRRQDELAEELAEHAAFEREVAPALREAARGFDDLARPHVLAEDRAAVLKREYGDEFFDRYRELWTLAHLDEVSWRSHERTHEDAFARREEPRSEEARSEEARADGETRPEELRADEPRADEPRLDEAEDRGRERAVDEILDVLAPVQRESGGGRRERPETREDTEPREDAEPREENGPAHEGNEPVHEGNEPRTTTETGEPVAPAEPVRTVGRNADDTPAPAGHVEAPVVAPTVVHGPVAPHESADAVHITEVRPGVYWVADLGPAPRATERALAHFPADPGHFTLAFHGTGPDGAPSRNGRPVTPHELAGAALDLYDRGVWDGRPLRLAGCDAGRGGADSYAARFAGALRELRPELKVQVDAPGGSLWSRPDRGKADGTHELVVARTVGFDAAGLPRVEGGGSWVRLSASPDHAEVRVTHVTGHPGEDSAPVPTNPGHPAPEHPAGPERRIVEPDPEAHEFGVGRQDLYARPEYDAAVRRFEEAVGKLAYDDPRALRAARNSVNRLYEVLKRAHGDPTGERVYKVFLGGDVTSAGQVGENLTLDQFHTMIETNGNLRELMTAFFNASYAQGNKDTAPLTLKHLLNDLADRQPGSADYRLSMLGMDNPQVPQRLEFLNSPSRWLSSTLSMKASYFARDYFATGATFHKATFTEQTEFQSSAKARKERPTPIPVDVAVINRDMPLSPRERSFQVTNPPGGVHWVPGGSRYELNTASAWYGETRNDKGLHLTVGLSATTAKMLTAFQALKVPEVSPEDMLLALVGWMLPLGDHTLYEILKGADLARELPPVPADTLTEAAVMYRHVPGLPEGTLREASVMLPHESVYHQLVSRPRDQGGYHEAELAQVAVVWARMTADNTANLLPHEREWLGTIGLTPAKLRARLSLAHVEALNIYTGTAYPLINVLLTHDGAVTLDYALGKQIDNLLKGPVDNLPSVFRDHQVLGPLLASGPQARTAEESARVSAMAMAMLPALKTEFRIHAEMIVEALDKLPGATGVVYRGEWAPGRLDGLERMLLAGTGAGSTHSSAALLSTSRLVETAERFLLPDRELTKYWLAHRVLRRIRLAGEGGVDITPFSRFLLEEQEILVKPGAVFTSTHIGRGSSYTGPYERVDQVETGAPRPFEWPEGSPEWPRKLHEELRSELTRLGNGTDLRYAKDLWPLAKAIGAHRGMPGADGAEATTPDPVLVRRATEHAWDTARIVATLHGAAGTSRAELTDVSLVVTLARTELRFPPDRRITLDDLHLFSMQVTQNTEAHKRDLRRLVAVARDITYTDHGTAMEQLRRALAAADLATTEQVGQAVHLLGDASPNHVAVARALRASVFQGGDHFSVLMPTVDGVPRLGGARLTPAEVAHAVYKLTTEGGWDPARTPLRLLATDLYPEGHRPFAEQVLEHLWRMDHRITAYAARGKVWLVRTDFDTWHVVAAEQAGVNGAGETVYADPGTWIRLKYGVPPESTPAYFDSELTQFTVNPVAKGDIAGPALHTLPVGGGTAPPNFWADHAALDQAGVDPQQNVAPQNAGLPAGNAVGAGAPPHTGPLVMTVAHWSDPGRPLHDGAGGKHGWVLDGSALPEFGFLSKSDAWFRIVVHTDHEGYPTVGGYRPAPAEMRAMIQSLQRDGHWDGRKDIEFDACRLAEADRGNYLRSIQRELHNAGLNIRIRAARQDVWFAPVPAAHADEQLQPTGGRAFVAAAKVGFDAGGFPVIAKGAGVWLEIHPYVTGAARAQENYAVDLSASGYQQVDPHQVVTELSGDLRFARDDVPVDHDGIEEVHEDVASQHDDASVHTGEDMHTGEDVPQPGHTVVEADGGHVVQGPVGPARPPRIDEHGLAASDVLIGLGSTRTQILDQLTRRFSQVLHGEEPAARTLAESLFGAETLQAKLTALSRGERWDVPFSVGSWSGTVRMEAEVGRSSFVRTAENFEFEYGSERQTSVGVTKDRLWQLNAAAQGKFKFGKPADLTETAGYQHGRQHGVTDAQASRMVARGKTVETAALYDTGFHLTVSFLDLVHHGAEVPVAAVPRPVGPVDVTAQVAVPLRETGGPLPLDGPPLLPPPGSRAGGRLAGSHIVTDVWAVPHRPAPVETEAGIPLGDLNAPRPEAKGMTGFIAGFEEQAAEHFGGDWPALKAKLIEEIDLGTLHQDLKALMSGETRTVELDGLLGASTVLTLKNARIHRIEHTADLPTTEFNIATGTSRTHVEQSTRSSGWQFPLPLSASGSAKNGGGGAGAGARTGREKVGLHGGGDDLGLGTKVKSTAAVFDGEARIEVEFGARRRGLQSVQARTVDAGLGFRVVVDRSETVQAPVHAGGDQAGHEQAGPVAHQESTALPPGTLVPHPPTGIWPGAAEYTGLPVTTVVRDVHSVAPLHARLDEIGRAQLGEKAWREVRQDVLRAFSQSAVGAHLVGMTHDVPLRTPAVTLGALSKLGIGVTAHATALTYRREQASADLNPVRESTTFASQRFLNSDSRNVTAQGFGKGPVHTRENVLDGNGKPFQDSLQGTATVTHEVRDRDGWRGGDSAKSYANGKYRSAQVLYDATFELHLTVNGKPHGDPVRLDASLSMEQAHTEPRARGSRVIANPFDGVAPRLDGARPQPPVQPAAAGQPPAHLRVPDRLGHSDVVLSVGRRGPSVLSEVERVLATAGPVSARASARLAAQLDTAGLTASLSRLSRGGRMTLAVDTGNWKGTVEVSVAPLALRHRRTVDGFEFELGSQQRTTVGYSWDRTSRWRGGLSLKGTVPHVSVTGEYAHTRDGVRGLTIERTGGTNSRGKSTETAELFDGDAAFTIRFAPDLLHRPLAGTTAVAPVVIAAPHREVVRPPVVDGPPVRHLPDRRFGSSDIVTRIHLDGGNGLVHTGPGAVTRVVTSLEDRGRAVLGRDWTGMRAKLLEALDFDRLHPLLKPMTSGHEIVLTHGRSTVRITASVDRITKSGDAPQVEFNIGAGAQTAFTSSEVGTNSGSGHADSVGVTVLATTDPLGAGVAVVAGGGVTHTRRQDTLEHRRDVLVTGAAVKSKVAAEAHRADVRLSVLMERRPAVHLPGDGRPVPTPVQPPRSGLRAAVHGLAEAGNAVVPQWRLRRTVAETVVHADVLTERDRAADGPTARGQRQGVVAAREVRVPPAEVFTSGLRPGDVLRWAGDTSGLRALLRIEGPRFFGEGTWKRLEPVVSAGLSHAQLSSLLAPATGPAGQQRPVATPSVGRRWFVDDAEVTVRLSLVQLEYHGDNAAAALSPANESGGGHRSTRLTGRQWNVRAQAGAQGDLGGNVEGTASLLGGVTHRQRAGVVTEAGGRTVANAKAATPMARYTGYVKVELDLRNGDTGTARELGGDGSPVGLVPIELEIPHAHTTLGLSPADHWTQFTPDHPGGHALPQALPLAVQVARALTPHHDGGVHVLHDPTAAPAAREQVERNVRWIQQDPRYFTIAYHAVTEDGAPGWNGGTLHPDALADRLAELHRSGEWDGRPLRFAACDARAYAEQVLTALRERLPDAELDAFVTNGKLWVAPHQGRTHLVVSRDVGWDAAGRPRVEPGGEWLHLRVPPAGANEQAGPQHEQAGPANEGAGVGAGEAVHGPVVQVVAVHGPALHDPHPLAEATPEHPITDRRGLQPLGTDPKQALHATPEHRQRAEAFEAKLGAYAYHHPKARAAARNAVQRLYDALRAAHPDVGQETLYKVFLRDDKGSAGQVGTDLTLAEFRTMVDTGNTRELMTAFYNAAYINDSDHGLKKVLQALLESGDAGSARAEAMGLDLRELKTQADFLNGGLVTVLGKVPGLDSMFTKDHFGTGVVIKQGAQPLKAGKEYLSSLDARVRRPEPLNDLTAAHFAEHGMPLSPRELTFQEHDGGDAPLGWKSGHSLNTMNEKSAWYGEAHLDKNMPVSTGISATTAKMLNAFRLLDVRDSRPQDMLLALAGWMLPLRDHSLYEILKGAELLGDLPPVPAHALGDVSSMYQHIPGIPQHEVRAALGEDGMLPHEAAYHELMSTPRAEGGWSDVTAAASRANRAAFQAARDGEAGVPAPVVGWLGRNPMTAHEVLDRLTPAHFDALAYYSGPSHALINVMLRFGPLSRRTALEYQINRLLENGFPQLLPSVLRHDPVLEPLLTQPPHARSEADRKALRPAVKRQLPRIERELLVHTELLNEALAKLPAWSGELWRGERVVGPLNAIGSRLSPTYAGSTYRNRDFVSTSTERNVARNFMQTRPQLAITHPALVHYTVDGGGSGFDIQPFSHQQGEHEVLLRPGSTFDLIDRTIVLDPASREYFEQIELTERPVPEAFPKATPEDLRLHEKLAELANIPVLRTHEDLWPLAEHIGADHRRPLSGRFGELLSGEAARRDASTNAWHTAKLALELRGADRITLDGLTRVRRTADLVREALPVPAGHPVTKAHLEDYVRKLRGSNGDEVAAADLEHLVTLVDGLKRPGHAVTVAALEHAWRDPGNAPASELLPLDRPDLYWVGGRGDDWRTLTESVFPHFPDAASYLTLAMHTSGGVPVLDHVTVAPADIARGLLKLHEADAWDGVKPLRFVGCDLNPVPNREYVREVMQFVWDSGLHGAVAYAADGRVWFTPARDAHGAVDPGRPGHLVVASDVGVTASGRPVVVPGGTWLRIARDTETQVLGPYLTGDHAGAEYPTVEEYRLHGRLTGAVSFGHETPVLDQQHTPPGEHPGDGPGPDALPFQELTLAPVVTPPVAAAVRHTVFDEPGYRTHAEDFEEALGTWAAGDPRALHAAREALRRVAEETGTEEPAGLLTDGSLPEVMRAFHERAAARFRADRPEVPQADEAWHADLAGRGIRTVAGVSRAAAEAMDAYRKLGGAEPEPFARALYGWLLPDGGHSLHEVVAGMKLAGAFPEHGHADGTGLYRDLPGVPLYELRPPVESWDGSPIGPVSEHPAPAALTDGLPHERAYLDWAATSREVDGAVLAETTNRREMLAETEPAPAQGVPAYQDWMARNGVENAKEVTDRLGHAHFVALYTYTGPAYSLINVLLKNPGPGAVPALREKIATLIAKHYKDGTALPKSIEDLARQAEGTSGRTDPWTLARSLTDERLGAIQKEMALHSHLLADALELLPASTGTLFRGDGTLVDPSRPNGRPAGPDYGGDVILHRTFASFSRNENTSLVFMRKYDGTTEYRVLLEVEATGVNGRDIAPFSSHMAEDEVLFLPGARMRVTERTLLEAEDGVPYVRLKAREESAEDTSGTDDTAHTDNSAHTAHTDNTAHTDDTAGTAGPGTRPDRTEQPAPPSGGVRLDDGRTVPDGQLLTHPITDATGRERGQALFDEGDWASRSALYPELSEVTTFVPRSADGVATGAPQRVPWDGKHTYFFAAHAGPHGFDLPLADGTKAHGVTGTEVGGLLKRKLADLALKAADAHDPVDGRPASITLLSCESAEHAQAVARQTGLPVHAPTGRTGVSGRPAGPDGPSTAALYVKAAPDGSSGLFRTFHPDPAGDTPGTPPPSGPSGPSSGERSTGPRPAGDALDNMWNGEHGEGQEQAGPVVEEYADRVVHRYPDDVEIHFFPGGEQVHYLHDGVEVHYLTDGQQLHYVDGQLVQHVQPQPQSQEPGYRLLADVLADRGVRVDPDLPQPRYAVPPPQEALAGPELPARPLATDRDLDVAELLAEQSTPPMWRHDLGLLYRWERQRPGMQDYEHVFEQGLAPRQENRHVDLRDYVGNNEASSFVSTTRSDRAQHVDWGTHRRYVIDAPGGIDVRATLEQPGLTELENEVAFPGGIDPQYVVGVELVEDVPLDPATGVYAEEVVFIPNEAYWPSHRDFEQVELMRERVLAAQTADEHSDEHADEHADATDAEVEHSTDSDSASDHSVDDIANVLNDLAVGSDSDNSAVPPTGGGQLPPSAAWLNTGLWQQHGITGHQAAEGFLANGGWELTPQQFHAMPRDFQARYAEVEFQRRIGHEPHETHARNQELAVMAQNVVDLEPHHKDSLEFYTQPSEDGEGDAADELSYFQVKQAQMARAVNPQLDIATALPHGEAIQEHITAIDEAIEQCPVTTPLLVSRGAPFIGLRRHPENLRYDQFVEEPTYVSATVGGHLHPSFAERLIRMHLFVPENSRGAYLPGLSESPDELEILFGGGLRWIPTRIIPPLVPLNRPLDDGEEPVPPESQWIVYGKLEDPPVYSDDEFEDYGD